MSYVKDLAHASTHLNGEHIVKALVESMMVG
jgi:hypothetical protein